MRNQTFNSKRRTTNGNIQQKKHFTQMDNKEVETCANLLRNCLRNNRLNMSEHAQSKLKAPINFKALVGMIFKAPDLNYIIEYNETTRYENTSHRVLVRHPQVTKVDGFLSYTYIVIDVNNGRIITTYYNKVTDHHDTLNMSYYTQDLKIMEV